MNNVILQIEQAISLRSSQKSGKEIRFLCPAHDDHHPSARWNGEKQVWFCDVCGAGGGWKDLAEHFDIDVTSFPENTCTSARPHSNLNNNKEIERAFDNNTNCTLELYSAHKKIPKSFLKGLYLSDYRNSGFQWLKIPYLDEQNITVATRIRTALCGDSRFRWRQKDKTTLYGIWKLKEAESKSYVVLVEGESDCHTLWYHKIPAIGIPGANTWKEEWSRYFEKIEKIYVFIEPDAGGGAVLRWLENSKIREKTILLRPDGFKDISELYLLDPDDFETRFKALMDSGVKWSISAEKAQENVFEAEHEKCQALLNNRDILGEFEKDLKSGGFAGCTKNAKIIYLALVSRFFERPISIVVKGQSSCGKSFLVETVLKYFPKEAYHDLSSMSNLALVYSEEPIKHRFIIFYEAAGIKADISEYILRSLISEGRIKYETVEKTKEGQKPRFIEREGPTGIIITTTAFKLHSENETRLLSLNVTDTSEQTRLVLHALASFEEQITPNYDKWHALHKCIALLEHRVVIPYSKRLAELISSANRIPVRFRRDFRHILSLIQAHAVLHQCSREKDSDGKIIATLNDYAVTRELLLDIISEETGFKVNATVRETVATVKELSKLSPEVTIKQLSEKLDLDESAVKRRVKKALSLGYLRNNEEHPKKTIRLVLGDEIPSAREILPNINMLSPVVHSCTEFGEDMERFVDHVALEERSAIMEFDGGLSRVEAEKQAKLLFEKTQMGSMANA